jgi:hypothetical protein
MDGRSIELPTKATQVAVLSTKFVWPALDHATSVSHHVFGKF